MKQLRIGWLLVGVSLLVGMVAGRGATLGKLTATKCFATNLYIRVPLQLNNLPGEILYVDVYSKATNNSGLAAGGGDLLKGWGDLSSNATNSLIQLANALMPTYSATGGPTNGPYVHFTAGPSYMTNYIGGASVAQPNTLIWVMKLRVPTTVGGTLNGQPGNVPQINESTANSGDFRWYGGGAGDVEFVNVSSAAGFGWTATWSILTMQWNGANSTIRLNGQPFPVGAPVTYALGSNPFIGLTIGAFAAGTPSAETSITALLYLNGSYWTTPGNLLLVEEALGKQYGITVP